VNIWKEYNKRGADLCSSLCFKKEKDMIKEIGNEMKKYVSDLEKNISNKEELEYLLKRTEKLFDSIFDELNKYADEEEKKIKEIKNKQKKQEKRMDEIETKMEYLDENIDSIFKDIYEEEDGDFKIKCPYCNYEFSADIDEHAKEIYCPECNNIIELDWSDNSEN
jgi:chromosome segregation ATPase